MNTENNPAGRYDPNAPLNYRDVFVDSDIPFHAWATPHSDNEALFPNIDVTAPAKADVIELLTHYEYALALSLWGMSSREVRRHSSQIRALLSRHYHVVSKLKDILPKVDTTHAGRRRTVFGLYYEKNRLD